MNYCKVCVIGDDPRMSYVAHRFISQGYIVYHKLDIHENYDYVVIPPNPNIELVLRIANYYSCKKIFGGYLDKDNTEYLMKLGIEYCNYLEYEDLLIENAIYTAKGIISFAKDKKAVLKESSCLLTGFGYCGKALACELSREGARVDIIVRSRALKNQIEQEGYGYRNFNDPWIKDADKYSYVFNSVPAPVINSEVINALSDNVIIFDIASRPGGTDFNYCMEHSIEAYLVLGIPGRYYPKEAGYIIANSIMKNN